MIIRSAHPDLTIPDLDFSPFALERARQLPEKTALVDAGTGERISYGQLTEAIDAAAGGLAARGLRQGDAVAICGFNSPDDEAGEIPKALVVLKGEATPDELMAFVADRVAPYKQVRDVELVDQIPKSPSGKILRRVLVERERAARAAAR